MALKALPTNRSLSLPPPTVINAAAEFMVSAAAKADEIPDGYREGEVRAVGWSVDRAYKMVQHSLPARWWFAREQKGNVGRGCETVKRKPPPAHSGGSRALAVSTSTAAG
jgi:hypothetical protein